MLITAATLNALRTSFSLAFNGGLTSFPSNYKKVATVVSSTTKSNTYGWIRDFPQLREWLGERVVKSLSEGSYQIENKPFESTVGVKRTDIEDDNLGIYKPMFEMMGQAVAQFPDDMVFPLLNAGLTTPCWDGQNFFDEEHPNGDAGPYSNTQGGTGAAWFLLDTSRPLKPLIYQERQPARFVAMVKDDDEDVFMKNEYRYGADLRANAGFGFPQMAYASQQPVNSDNYSAAREAMTSMVGETGRKLNIKPNLAVFGPSNRTAFLELIIAERLANGGSNIFWKDIDLLEVPWLD